MEEWGAWFDLYTYRKLSGAVNMDDGFEFVNWLASELNYQAEA